MNYKVFYGNIPDTRVGRVYKAIYTLLASLKFSITRRIVLIKELHCF